LEYRAALIEERVLGSAGYLGGVRFDSDRERGTGCRGRTNRWTGQFQNSRRAIGGIREGDDRDRVEFCNERVEDRSTAVRRAGEPPGQVGTDRERASGVSYRFDEPEVPLGEQHRVDGFRPTSPGFDVELDGIDLRRRPRGGEPGCGEVRLIEPACVATEDGDGDACLGQR